MCHHFTGKGNRRYGAYVCQTIQKRGAQACPGSRVAVGKLETAVVEHIQAIGKDPQLVAETVQATQAIVDERGPAIRDELSTLSEQRRRWHDEQQRLVDAIAASDHGPASLLDKLGEIETGLEALDDQATALRNELAALRTTTLDEDQLRQAIAGFMPVWEHLFPQERARILNLLIEQITVDVAREDIGITFRPSGIQTLVAEGREEAA